MIEFKLNGINTNKSIEPVYKTDLEKTVNNTIFHNNSFLKQISNYEEINNYKEALENKNYNIKVLDVKNVENSIKYNPLLNIDKNNEKDIWNVADTIVDYSVSHEPDRIQNVDGFMWDLKAKLLLKAIIGYILEHDVKENRNFRNILRMLQMESSSLKNEKTALDLLFEKWMNDSETEKDKNINSAIICWKMYKKFTEYNRREQSIIVNTLNTVLIMFQLDKANKFISDDEVQFNKSLIEKTAYFVVVSDKGDSVFNIVGDIFVNQLLNTVK